MNSYPASYQSNMSHHWEFHVVDRPPFATIAGVTEVLRDAELLRDCVETSSLGHSMSLRRAFVILPWNLRSSIPSGGCRQISTKGI